MSSRDVLIAFKQISLDICNAYNHFDDKMNSFHIDSRNAINFLQQYKESKKVSKEKNDLILKAMTDGLNELDRRVHTNEAYINEKKIHVEELKKTEKELSRLMDNKELLLNKLKKDIRSHKERKGKKLEYHKKKATFLRTITSTTFDFQNEESATGYTIGDNCIKPFSFELSDFTTEDISVKLWDHVLKTFTQD